MIEKQLAKEIQLKEDIEIKYQDAKDQLQEQDMQLMELKEEL